MRYIQKFYFAIAGIISFVLYLFTIAPSVVQIDSGELATVQYTLGIAHPTGYPLFTILGYLFSHIPLPFTKIYQLNLLATIYCSIAVSIFTITSKSILDNILCFQILKKEKVKKKKDKSHKKNLRNTFEYLNAFSENTKILISIIAGIILAFSKTFWFQSTSVEVYSLHLLLINLIIFVLLKAYILGNDPSARINRWYILSIALALGFANHMTTLLVIPSIVYLYFDKNRFSNTSIKQIAVMLSIFFPILILLYLYLPIRASQSPILNWGNPIDLERILRHISGKQYQVWLFSSTEAASKQFTYFIYNLPKEYFISLILIIIGLYVSFTKSRKFFIFNLILFISTVLYSINYDINDIDAYFLLAYISLAFFALFGIVQLVAFLKTKKVKTQLAYGVIILFPLFQIFSNIDTVTQKDNYTYQDYTKSLINSLPEKSIVFSYQWDYLISPSYYFQIVENFRPDIILIDKELLRRSWYYNQIERDHPGLLKGIRSEVDNFLDALKPFERSENFNPNSLENLFRKIMTGLISTNIKEHHYFIAPELVEGEMSRGDFQLPKGYTLVPYSFLYEVVTTNDYVESPLPDFEIRFLKNKDKYAESLQNIIGRMLVRRGLYEMNFNFSDRAKIYVEKIETEFPDINLPPQLKKLINN